MSRQPSSSSSWPVRRIQSDEVTKGRSDEGNTAAVSNPSRPSNPYRPIAVGFYLLALPLFVAVLLADSAAGRWTNIAVGAVMVFLGFILHRSRA